MAEPDSKPGTTEFHGEQYLVTETIGSMALMRFAKLAQTDDVGEQESLVAIYDLLETCFDPADWERFQQAAMKHRSDTGELMDVVKQVFKVVADRPTSRPADSSDGPLSTEPSSMSTHVDRAIAQLDGRPDLQLVVVRAQEAMAS